MGSPISPRRAPASIVATTLPALLLALAACGGEGGNGVSSSGPKAPEPNPSASAATGAPAASAPGADASGSSAAAPSAAPGTPKDLNVLVLSIDSWRADRAPWAGYKRAVTPNIAKFAEESVVWSRFYATSSYTASSLGGFLGGKHPSAMKRSGYFFSAYPEEEVMFPELLQKAGVTTSSAQAHFYFSKEKAGFHQGFDHWDLIPDLKKSNTTDENITSPRHTELALQQMEAAGKKGRFFAWYHLLDPHDQYMGHKEAPDFGKGATNSYDGELFFTDLHVGKILDFVSKQPWGAKTAIILTSDHGEAFGEKKMHRHGFELWEVLVQVPLLMKVPGVAARKIEEPRGMIDLAPTILELFGVPKDGSMYGESLVGELRGGEAKPRDVVVDLPRTSDNDRRRAVIRGKYKLLAFGDDQGFQLYDVVADPKEENDLARKEKAVFEEMKAAYAEASKKIPAVCPKMTEKLKGKGKGKPC